MKKRALSLLMSFVMVIGLLPATTRAVENDQIGTVTFSVETKTIDGNYLVEPMEEELYEGDTVYSILSRVAEEKNLTVTGAEMGYVTKINDFGSYTDSAYGTESGWMAAINDDHNTYPFPALKDGDSVRFCYTYKTYGYDIDLIDLVDQLRTAVQSAEDKLAANDGNPFQEEDGYLEDEDSKFNALSAVYAEGYGKLEEIDAFESNQQYIDSLTGGSATKPLYGSNSETESISKMLMKLEYAQKGDAYVAATGADITVAGSPESYYAGHTYQLSAAIKPSNATITEGTWKVVEITGEASIDSNGTLTMKKAGMITVQFWHPDAANGTLATKFMVISEAPLFETVMHNIAAKYAASGVASDGNSYWFAADLAAYAKTFPGTENQLSAAQKQAMVDVAVKTLDTSTKPGDQAKAIIALVAMGYDPAQLTTSAGTALNGVSKLVAQVNGENNGAVTNYYTLPYVMIALQQFGTTYQTELDKLIASALSQQESWLNTQWGTDGVAPVVLALAPYYQTNTEVKAALDAALIAMAECQTETGDMGGWGPAASTGLVMAAAAAMGELPGEFKYAESGKSLVDGLMGYVNTAKNGFTPDSNSFATEQGLRGLIAAANAKKGTSYCIYDFSGQTLVPAVATFWAQGAVVSFKTIPEGAEITLKQGETPVSPAEGHDGCYDLAAGEYTYTASRQGYQTKTGTFTVTQQQAERHEAVTVNVSLAAVSSGESKKISVTVKVMVPPEDTGKLYTYKHDGSEYSDLITVSATVALPVGTSARDAMVTVLDANGIEYYEQSNGYFPTIGDWTETERGEGSGWMYLVNGVMPNVAAADYELTRKSTVTWFYTDDYTRDYGSEDWSGSSKNDAPEQQPQVSIKDYTDLSEDGWYIAGVAYVLNKGLMTGTDAKTFAPDAAATRAQLVTILWRLAGAPKADKSVNYTDTDPQAWYAQALAWAVQQGLVSGYDDGRFAPDDIITREQFAAVLMRFVQMLDRNTADDQADLNYADAQNISTWARQAMSWCVVKGILSGTGADTLSPQMGATRAQMAVMLMQLCETIGK